MTAAVAGMTGKTGVPLFLAHKNQREGRDKNKRKIYIVYKFPGISGFFGRGASALYMLEREIVAAIIPRMRRCMRAGIRRCICLRLRRKMRMGRKRYEHDEDDRD